MRILVTGAAGFLGAHTVAALCAAGHDVTGLDNFSPFHPRELKERRWTALVKGAAPLVEGDIRDADTVAATLRDAHADVVIHLAAQAGIRFANRHPDLAFDVNVEGSRTVFDAARNCDAASVIYASSSSVYGDRVGPCREEDPVVPTSHYGATKLAVEQLALDAARTHHQPSIGARLFTVYGPWGRPDMAYYRLFVAAITGRPFPLFGDLDTVRDFTFVDDTVRTLVALVDRAPSLDDAVAVNVGGGAPCSLRDQLALVSERCGHAIDVTMRSATPGDVRRTEASTARLVSWGLPIPTTTLAAGLDACATWFRTHEADAVRWADPAGD